MNVYFSTYRLLVVMAFFLLASCHPGNNKQAAISSLAVKDSVASLAFHIQQDITAKGPSAWPDYFENSPDFFMASDGQLVFKDYPSAKTFIEQTLVKSIRRINLRFTNLRVDVLTDDDAIMGADFHEDLTDFAAKEIPVNGYFTATAHFNGTAWKLRNLHWSIKH